ncbi:hypothetical protein [Thiolapillus sp.]|uniref:hypothetical protein n=1 Tax=Thiolapillus sp. TaxID=2017437 RepID=UPI003AF7C215
MCLLPRDRFWDIPVPKIDSAFDNLLVPQPSWSPSTTQQLRKLVAAPYLSPNDWTPRLDAYFASPLALCARRVSSAASRLLGSTSLRFALHGWQRACLRPRDRFWDIPVPKIDSAFDNPLVPQPSWSPSTTQQLRKLVAAPYLAPNDWTPRSEAYFVFPLAQGTPGKQCGLAATGDYQPSLRSPWLAAKVIPAEVSAAHRYFLWITFCC